jgi:mannose-6-phosphate isomerase-like protein (cupin superfamily)
LRKPTCEVKMVEKRPRVIREDEGGRVALPGGGYGKRMIGPNTGGKLGMGVIYVHPGESPHRWHTHDRPDKSGEYEIHYPGGFEEGYIIVHGEGIVQWKEGNEIREEKVHAGDAVFFPAGVAENQVVNTGTKPMIVVFGYTPLPEIKT